MATKAGIEPAANFAATPTIMKAAVAFGTPFATTAYAITADAVTTNAVVYEVAIESKTVSGFTINLGSQDKNELTEVGWQAIEEVS